MALPPIGARVRVHKNLNRGDWSVTVSGKVVAHVREVVLAGVTFRVREGARQRVLARKCREVQAWCEGVLAALPSGLGETPITYNPYRAGAFTTRAGVPLARCEYVHFTADREAVALGETE